MYTQSGYMSGKTKSIFGSVMKLSMYFKEWLIYTTIINGIQMLTIYYKK